MKRPLVSAAVAAATALLAVQASGPAQASSSSSFRSTSNPILFVHGYYLKNLAGTSKVDAWVSLGGPNHGTDSANSCFDTSCTEMRIGSNFLAALDSGDETPGSPRYATWWSPCDTVINPDSSVSLSGATNTQTTCLSHTDLLIDATVYAQTRDMVNR
ncbi:hypothetical protein ACIP4Y_32555 [Streptomyces sp. NPDC088810]|uniref:hypothetical protein n=1 Tax=Streptomyces sp. NPDC088810 TaxID=3365904 RepID=UPI00382A4EDF